MRNRARRILERGRARLPEWSQPRVLVAAGLCFVVALFATGLVLADLRDPPEALLFVGRFHPMIVHFPIALLALAALLEVAAALHRPLRAARHATGFVLFLGTVSAVASVVAGYLLSLEGGYEPALLRTHMWLGLGVAAAAVVATGLKIRSQRAHPRKLDRAYAGVLLACVGMLLLAGHLGAALTHGQGYLTQYLPAPLERLLGPAEARAATRIADIDSAYVYRDLVVPIFQARCTSCHNQSKVRGGLRLDTPEGLVKGGDDGPVLVAGSPEESELLRRITLGPHAEGAMPPDGAPPLDVGETELIRWWIANGASLEHRVADIEEIPTSVATLFNRVAPPRAGRREGIYALDASPADPAAMAALRKAGYGVAPVAQDLELLQVSTTNNRASVGDDELGPLVPLAPQITWLDLGATRVGDRGLAVVARMPNLTRLSLARTAVTDAGLRQLGGLRNLEYLNLFGTGVADAGLEHLQRLDRLKAVYLWETRVTAEGVERLRAARPELQVILGADPPGDPPEPREPGS